jgi:hypothetical protein
MLGSDLPADIKSRLDAGCQYTKVTGSKKLADGDHARTPPAGEIAGQ